MRLKRTIVIFINVKLLYLPVIVCSLIIGLWMWNEPAIWTSLPITSMVSGKKVVIDAGHGGGDPGAKSSLGVLEKEINLDVACRLKKYLSRIGVYCIMIREKDQDFFNSAPDLTSKKRRDLEYRTRVANESGAEIFLSIHANSFPQTIYRGAQTFFNRKDPRSRRLAQAIQYHLVKELGPNNRLPKAGDFLVLNLNRMPGAIIEIGFLSNPEEAGLLSQAQYRERVAEAIYHGVIGYFTNQIGALGEDSNW